VFDTLPSPANLFRWGMREGRVCYVEGKAYWRTALGIESDGLTSWSRGDGKSTSDIYPVHQGWR